MWKSISAHELRPISEQLSESFLFYDQVGLSELIIPWSGARPGQVVGVWRVGCIVGGVVYDYCALQTNRDLNFKSMVDNL